MKQTWANGKKTDLLLKGPNCRGDLVTPKTSHTSGCQRWPKMAPTKNRDLANHLAAVAGWPDFQGKGKTPNLNTCPVLDFQRTRRNTGDEGQTGVSRMEFVHPFAGFKENQEATEFWGNLYLEKQACLPRRSGRQAINMQGVPTARWNGFWGSLRGADLLPYPKAIFVSGPSSSTPECKM